MSNFKKNNKLISTLLLFVIMFQMGFASASFALERNEFIYKTAQEVYNELDENSKILFLREISKDKDLVEFHNKNVDEKIYYNSRVKRSTSALTQLSSDLKSLGLSSSVRYSLMAIGGALSAAAADGPLPIGDIIGCIISLGAISVLAWNWNEVQSEWDEIVCAFEDAFSSMGNSIGEAFDSIKIKIISYNIKKELLKDEETVDLEVFNEKVKGKTVKYRNRKTGWYIEKDTANHGGRKWKLKDKKGKRKASLGEDGEILAD